MSNAKQWRETEHIRLKYTVEIARYKCLYKCCRACADVFRQNIGNGGLSVFIVFQVPGTREDTIVERGGARHDDLAGRMGRHAEQLYRNPCKLSVAVGRLGAPYVSGSRGSESLLREC